LGYGVANCDHPDRQFNLGITIHLLRQSKKGDLSLKNNQVVFCATRKSLFQVGKEREPVGEHTPSSNDRTENYRLNVAHLRKSYLDSYMSSKLLVLVSCIGCVIAVAMIAGGLSESQRFALGLQSVLLVDPAILDPSLALNKLAAHPPLQQILLYFGGLKFQLWIAVGLWIRLCGLLMRNKFGAALAQVALLLVLYDSYRYIRWSFDLLYCTSCLQKGFLIAASPPMSYLFLLSLLLIVLTEIVFVVGYFHGRTSGGM
jgi:hypothetical protein